MSEQTEKDKIIEKIYFDPAGYGSITTTLKDARVFDKTITYEDVKQWKEKTFKNEKHN